MHFPSIERRKGTLLPGEFWAAHELCFCIHDAMTQMLVSGQSAGAFHVRFELSEEEKESLENSEDIFKWLDQYRNLEDRTAVLITTVFPAILSDLHHLQREIWARGPRTEVPVVAYADAVVGPDRAIA